MDKNMQTILPNSITTVEDVNKVFPNEKTCIDYLTRLRWNGNVESPFVLHSKVYECKDNRYRCSRSKKYFNVKTNTIFHNSRISLIKWFEAIHIITVDNPSITSVALSQNIGTTQKTAWYMIQRIRAYFDISKVKAVKNRKEKNLENAISKVEDIGTKNMTEWLKSLKS